MTRLLGEGRYVVGGMLGMGGMGAVYEAEDLASTSRVAIKMLHAEDQVDGIVATHMAREACAGRAIRHPNVVAVLDCGCDDGRPFIVMELALGRTLNIASTEEQMSVRRAVGIVDQILAGVDAIHRAGYVHGDLKTDNVLVAHHEHGGDIVKIIDLGLACERAIAPRTTDRDEQLISGTPDYLAPELALGGAKSVASELYAVGVILYELLTGSTPFGGTSMFEILRRQVEEEVMPPTLRAPELRLSLALERVVLHALEKRPDARYADASEFRAALRAAIQMSACEFSTSAPTHEWTRPEQPPRPKLAAGTHPPGLRGPRVIIEAALDAAHTHTADHRLAAAQRELEAALRLIEGDPAGDFHVWRLQLALAAVCDGLRDVRRARQLARTALDGAVRANSEIGKQRAKALIERFVGRGRAIP